MTGAVDILVAGAGPAGAIAALLLARAGARVLLVDRARFPRPKLCGDTLNPGTMDLLARLDLRDAIIPDSIPIEGMIVTGAGGARVRGTYPHGKCGVAMTRQVLDARLLASAIAAGVVFDEQMTVREAIVADVPAGSVVRGAVLVNWRGTRMRVPAAVTIAADGRRSALAFGLGLAHHPGTPRRWAIGRYFTGVRTEPTYGEMHIRGGYYIGVAPLPGGMTNVCLVTASRAGFADPADLLRRVIAAEPELADRFAAAAPVGPARVVGPLAVDVRAAGMPGLLLAGDAAGFIDPMTGDGVRFAVRGAELAAATALEALRDGPGDAHVRLAARRRRAFTGKWRFNRALRGLVASPAGVAVAARVAPCAGPVLRRLIAIAGDAA